MAAKIKMLKLLQEIRGFAEMSRRRPPPRLPALMLSQMRSHVVQATLTKRRLNVRTSVNDRAAVSRPVRIVHVKHGPAAQAAPPAS